MNWHIFFTVSDNQLILRKLTEELLLFPCTAYLHAGILLSQIRRDVHTKRSSAMAVEVGKKNLVLICCPSSQQRIKGIKVGLPNCSQDLDTQLAIGTFDRKIDIPPAVQVEFQQKTEKKNTSVPWAFYTLNIRCSEHVCWVMIDADDQRPQLLHLHIWMKSTSWATVRQIFSFYK